MGFIEENFFVDLGFFTNFFETLFSAYSLPIYLTFLHHEQNIISSLKESMELNSWKNTIFEIVVATIFS